MPEPSVWIGANFWSRIGGPRMWSSYDRDVIREELAVLAEHGLSVTRSFCYWPDFVPAIETLDEDVIARFQDFLDAHIEVGMTTIPTFIVGHMSGENWDPSWREGRDLYRNVWMVAQQAWFAEVITARFTSHPAVVGWLITNEMPIYGGEGSIDEITSWARIMVNAVKAGGATQPISLGDGAWGIEVTGVDNGYSLRAIAPLVDFIGPHVYPMSNDLFRQSLTAAFNCELSRSFGRPVVLEEFGLTSDFVSDENGAHYYRQVLYSSLLAGATGWIGWNNCDYDDLLSQDPYRHHPFELHFGLTDRKGQPKPQLKEIQRFSSFIKEISAEGWSTEVGQVSLVVPEHFERELPFTTEEYRREIRDNLLQSYVVAREADLPVVAVRERDGIDGNSKLLLLPSSKMLMAPTAAQLEGIAAKGSVVYLSYFAGATAVQRGTWVPWLNEIFGFRQALHYGLVNFIEDDEVVLTFEKSFGDIEANTTLTWRTAGNDSGRAFLPVEATDAEVIARDQHGRPAILRRQLGKGSLVFCTFPLEYMAATSPRVNPDPTWRLYSALAEEAGVERPIRVLDPRVMVGRLQVGNGERVILINLSGDEVVTSVVTETSYVVAQGGEAVTSIVLAPFDVLILRRAIATH